MSSPPTGETITIHIMSAFPRSQCFECWMLMA